MIYWGALLRELRETHFMLQKEVAALLHMSRQSYCNLENGRTRPTPEELAALSYIYNVNLLNYVEKCIPARYLAEQSAYRLHQKERCEEVLLAEEDEDKKKSLPRIRRKLITDPEGDQGAEPGTHREYSRNRSKVVLPGSGKRRTPKQYHNTTNLSCVALLNSKTRPEKPRKRREEQRDEEGKEQREEYKEAKRDEKTEN